MSKENPLWGAPRIHGELLKLGFEVAESTVSKYMIERRGPSGFRTYWRWKSQGRPGRRSSSPQHSTFVHQCRGRALALRALGAFTGPQAHYMRAMCNRIRGLKEWSDIPRSLAGKLINFEYNPNVAPTEQVPAFLAERGKALVTKLARFGINLPAKGGKKRPPLLNARTDSLRRGSFKTMLAKRRCVIPAEGFYEWREEDGLKEPYFFARKDGKPVMFAGIWDYSEVKGETVPSFAILTDEPNELVAPYHDRMPIVLSENYVRT
jgi:putative SOS response-associated peptidase YedK